MVLLQPIGDEVADGADLEAVGAGEIHEIVEAGHGPVLAHDLADDAAGVEAGEARNVDRRLGMAGADEDAAGPRDQRENVAGGDDGVVAVTGVDRDRDGAGAVGGADSVVMPSFASIETVKAVSLRLRLVRVIGSRPSWSARSLVRARQMRPAAVAGHEIDRIGRRHLRGDDEVALILAIFVVDEDEHAPVARLVDDFLGPDQHFGGAALDQFFEPPQRIGGRIPVRLAQFAEAVGMKPGGTGKAGAADLASVDDGVQALDEGRAHAGHISHLQCDEKKEQTCSYCARAAIIRSR